MRMVQGTQDPGAAEADGADPPNLVFVLTDDMRDDDLDHMPITRRLLADQGMEFTDAISPHPLCCPARAQLATGQYAQNNGVQHNRGVHGGFQALDPTQEASTWFRDAAATAPASSASSSTATARATCAPPAGRAGTRSPAASTTTSTSR